MKHYILYIFEFNFFVFSRTSKEGFTTVFKVGEEATEVTKATKAWTVGLQRTLWQATARAEVADVGVVAEETGEAEVMFTSPRSQLGLLYPHLSVRPQIT